MVLLCQGKRENGMKPGGVCLMNVKVLLSDNRMVGTGWRPPVPDIRDYAADHPVLKDMMRRLGMRLDVLLPSKTDLRKWCSPIETQGMIGSCTAHAAAGILEYFERRAFSHSVTASRLFIYKNARNLQCVSGDVGSYIRDVMGALALCGVPPEKYWPYTDKDPDFDAEPPAFVYAVADHYAALRYFCHDAVSAQWDPDQVLRSVKRCLAAGIPSMFGFFGFDSFDQSDVPGGIPYPGPDEQSKWSHAVMAAGYDDKMKITNKKYNTTSTGAILIRNCWGTSWGDQGYGWIPYDYILHQQASDFWSLLDMDWINTKEFGL